MAKDALTQKQQNIVMISSYTAKGDLTNLEKALNKGLDEGYAYGSFHRELAQRFAQTILVIHTPKGAKVSRCGAHGGEVLFPRGAQYSILSKNKSPNGQYIIVLEYILPKTESF